MFDPKEIERQHPDLRNVQSLASGGQKDVFSGFHQQHGRVVVKVIKTPGVPPRMQREIDAAEKLSSSHIPKILELRTISVAGVSHASVVEEFVEGETLRSLLSRGPLPLKQVLGLIETLLAVCVELEAAHIVHRDIKPDNILRDQCGRWWLLDLGIARHLDLTSLTDSLQQLGPHTPGYAAPEQFRNRKQDIDIRADLFSVGIVAFEAITGTHPFRDGARDALECRRRTETVSLPHLQIAEDSQGQLAGFISVLTDRFPSRRPMSAREALEWFRALRPTITA